MITAEIALLLLSLMGFDPVGPPPNTLPSPTQTQPEAVVWYLGHCGFAVQVGGKLLIFDYSSEMGSPPAHPEAGGLDDGYVDPGDLEGLDVYVFVSHSHSDHYDETILEWEAAAESITYLFGWAAGENPDHHYMVGPRATAEVDGVQVYTINSHHSGVPEVGYLLHVDGLWIYHNGDYQQEYEEDFPYLGTFTDHIDLVFTAGVPEEVYQSSHQAVYLMEHFRPDALFPMHHGGREEAGEVFARVMRERGFDTPIIPPARRGDRFEITVRHGSCP